MKSLKISIDQSNSVCTSKEDFHSMQSSIDSWNLRAHFIRTHQSMEQDVILCVSVTIDNNNIDVSRQLRAQ